MIYLWDENVEFYDSLENKSQKLNLYIEKLRREVTEDTDNNEFEELVKKLQWKNQR